MRFLRRLKYNFLDYLLQAARKDKRGRRWWIGPIECFRLAWNFTRLEMRHEQSRR